MRAVRLAAALTGLLVTGAACTSTSEPGASPGGTSPVRSSAISTALPSTAPPSSAAPVSNQAQLYAAALGERSPVASRLRRVTYLVARFCTGMIDIGHRGPCRAGPIPTELQRQLRALAGPNLKITAHPPPVDPQRRFPRAVVVQFGTPVVRGDTARLAVDYRCGPMCGRGDTLLLTRADGRWAVTGRTGPGWSS